MSEQIDVEGLVTRSFGKAFDVFVKEPVLYLVGGVILAVLGGITLGIMAGPLYLGFVQTIRKRLRDEPAEIGDIFGGLSTFVPALLVVILLGLGIFIGSLLLVLPGLAFAFVTMFTFQAMAAENLGVGASISRSFEIVKQHLVPCLIVFVLLMVIGAVGAAIPFAFLVTMPFSIITITVVHNELASAS